MVKNTQWLPLKGQTANRLTLQLNRPRKRQLKPKPKQGGMTLLELLVVMVILGMVSALLVQGMGTALVTYERVQHQQQQSMEPTLAYSWLKSSLLGAQAEPDAQRQFSGDSQQLSGYTHRPLVGDTGIVQSFSWQLVSNDQQQLQLIYQQPGVNWPVLIWPKGTKAQFFYRSLSGELVSDWPHYENEEPEADGRMPSALLLEITEPDKPLQRWYTFMPGRPFPRGDFRDING